MRAGSRRRWTPLYTVLAILGISIVGFTVSLVRAVTPNPGHPWVEVGDGTFAVTGPTALRTYTFPDANATVLTTASILASANGGTGNGFTKFSGPATSEKTFTLPNASAAILTDNADVTLALGGTGSSLTASNGGIFYSDASVGQILAGTATAGRMLMSGASAAPSWSTATWPSTAGASGNVLTSDGTNWVSLAPAGGGSTAITSVSRPALATGALSAVAVNSLTTRKVGAFTLDSPMTVNKITFSVGAVTTAGTMKVCLYNEAGTSKLIDVTSGTVTANSNTVSVPAVTLSAGHYYAAIGCATTCNDTVNFFVTTALGSVNGTALPSGELALEGTVTHTSGTCNATLGTITAAITNTPALRIDN